MRLRYLLCAATLLCLPTLPVAAQPAQPGGLVACRQDAAAYCGQVDPGAGRRVKCLAQNMEKLTPECAAVVRSRMAGQVAPPVSVPPATADPTAVSAVRPLAACRPDVAALCAGVEAGGGRRIACLRQNEAKVSAPCAAALAQSRDVRARLVAACRSDMRRLCADKRGAERTACLQQNAQTLAPACRVALEAIPARPQAK